MRATPSTISLPSTASLCPGRVLTAAALGRLAIEAPQVRQVVDDAVVVVVGVGDRVGDPPLARLVGMPEAPAHRLADPALVLLAVVRHPEGDARRVEVAQPVAPPRRHAAGLTVPVGRDAQRVHAQALTRSSQRKHVGQPLVPQSCLHWSTWYLYF